MSRNNNNDYEMKKRFDDAFGGIHAICGYAGYSEPCDLAGGHQGNLHRSGITRQWFERIPIDKDIFPPQEKRIRWHG